MTETTVDRMAVILAAHHVDSTGIFCAQYGKSCRFAMRQLMSPLEYRLAFARHQAEMLVQGETWESPGEAPVSPGPESRPHRQD